MSHRKLGLKTLGICLVAALGLMAFSAAGAQAEWLINGAKIPAGLNAQINGVIDVQPILHTTFGGSKILIECKEFKVAEGVVVSGAEVKGKGEFTVCTTFINGVANANCKPAEPIVANAKVLPRLHKPTGHAEELTYALFEPREGESFTILKFKEPCILPEEVKITGHSTQRDCQNEMLVEKVTHLLEEVNLNLNKGLKEFPVGSGQFPEGLFFGNNPATISGSFNWSLIGAHLGMKWSGH